MGTGAGPVVYIVNANATADTRIGHIKIGGNTYTITQQGYELSISPAVAEVGSNAGAGQFGVAAPIDAVWEAISDCDWITIIGARTGIGDGVIQYAIADNTTGETRVGRIVVAGKTYTLTQKTTLPVAVQVRGQGSVQGSGDYTQGASATLTATPAPGYVFSHWSGDAVGVEEQVSFRVDAAKEVVATFIPETVAQKLAASSAGSHEGYYTRDQIHALEVGNLVFDVDEVSKTARIGVQLMETDDLSDPTRWTPVGISANNLDVGSDGSVGMNVRASGKTRFYKIVIPQGH